jgi:DNA polymerase V
MKAIVDCNSFYCSCERLFKPELKTHPVVVLSNNDGCIVSRSDEAKKLGVQMAGPYFQAIPLIQRHNVATFSSNYALYGDLSWRVMETLRSLSSTVEVYSVDEAFMDLSMVQEDQLEAEALHIRERVEQWTGISVSVGVAPTKTLAKLANYHAKKDKQATNCIKVISTPGQIAEMLRTTRINHVWGVGRANANKLINQGITSAWELSQMPEEWGHRHLGGVTGVRLIRELKGLESIGMEEPLKIKKMIATTRMFGDPVSDITSIKEAVATYTSRAAEKLRRQRSAASVVSVFIVSKEQDHLIDFSHGPYIGTHTTLPSATSVTQELIKPAIQLVEQLFTRGKEYKKAGVMLSGLVPDDSVQGNLFALPQENNNRYLMDVLDNVNFSMRDDVLKFASAGLERNWKMRQNLRSARYTTRWGELFEVK